MISLCMLTIDRFEITKKTFLQNWANIGDVQAEMLVADNGSKDQRIVDYFKDLNIAYHRVNKQNEGVSRAFNQLFLRAKGDVIVLMGNDITLPKGWGKELYKYCMTPKLKMGLVGIQCTVHVNCLSGRNGVIAHWIDPKIAGSMGVFGVTAFNRNFLEDVGGFCELFHPYGGEDSDLNYRALAAGYNCCYVPNMKSEHLGEDAGQDSEYRKMKDQSLKDNYKVMKSRVIGPNQYKIPLPEMKAPL